MLTRGERVRVFCTIRNMWCGFTPYSIPINNIVDADCDFQINLKYLKTALYRINEFSSAI